MENIKGILINAVMKLVLNVNKEAEEEKTLKLLDERLLLTITHAPLTLINPFAVGYYISYELNVNGKKFVAFSYVDNKPSTIENVASAFTEQIEKYIKGE